MKEAITGILLTGGQSTRMGNDKATTLFKGKPLVEWAIEALQPLCTELLICSSNPKHRFAHTRTLPDLPGVRGPLSGLGAGLQQSSTSVNLVLACDTPLVTTSVLQEIMAQLGNHQAVVVADRNGKIHPLIGCYRIDILTQLKQVLTSNRQSMMHLLDRIDYLTYTPSDDAVTLNVNFKDQLQ